MGFRDFSRTIFVPGIVSKKLCFCQSYENNYMKKWIGFFSPLIMFCILKGFDHNLGTSSQPQIPASLRIETPTEAVFPKPVSKNSVEQIRPPFLGSSLIGFKEALAFSESSGNYFTTNTLGYLGKYQFGIGTLQLLGITNAARFLSTPELQEQAFITNLSRNKWILRREIAAFSGKQVKGVEVTESGILAAAHLAGAGNVKRYLRSGGAREVTDAYGTSISRYMRKFHGFDTSYILPEKNPRIL